MDKKDEKKPVRSKKQLILYTVALFTMAFVLIGISYVSQWKAQRQVQALDAELTMTKGSLQKLEALSKLSEEQENKILALEDENTELKKENEKLIELIEEYQTSLAEGGEHYRTLLGYDLLSKLQNACAEKEWELAQDLLSKLQAGGLDTLLGTEAQGILHQLAEKINEI